MKTALILGGGGTDPIFLATINALVDLVICADSGAEAAREAAVLPDIIIGDMDSVTPRTLDHFRGKGVRIIRDTGEDLLDTELAVLKAIESGAERMIVVGAWGSRIDQSLASLGLLYPENIPLSIGNKDKREFSGEIYVITGQSIIQRVLSGSRIMGHPGRRIALVPLPHAEGVTTRGLRYELQDFNLSFGETMSISNYIEQEEIEITYNQGDLALIRYFETRHDLVNELKHLTGKNDESKEGTGYHAVLREIYDHGGTIPSTSEGKEVRLKFTSLLLDSLCPSHDRIKIIHIAGTTGKGSVALYLHSILSLKFRTGLIISPHVYDFNERIRINGKPIPHSEVVRLWDGIKERISGIEKTSGETVLFQEIVILLAFEYFLGNGVEWAVVETGLGGRYDQTRVLSPAATLITRIGLDHTHILGDTIQKIAREKAGIIRKGIPVYTSERQGDDVFEIIRKRCEALSSSLYEIFPDEIQSVDDCQGMKFSLDNSHFKIPNPGIHQAENAALAVAVAKGVTGVDEELIRKGLERTELAGRIEFRGRLIVDTGHNTGELRALFSTLNECLPEAGRKVVVCGFSDTKDHKGMLEEILSFADIVIFTRAGYRGTEPDRLMEIALTIPEIRNMKGILIEKEPMRAFELGREMSGVPRGRGYLIVTGSTFLVDEIFNPDEQLRRVNSGK